MDNPEASVFGREVERASVAAHLRTERLERRIHRGRQIVARQRALVTKFGGEVPIALALLETFESSLAIFEKTLAARQRDEVLIARAEQAVRNSKAVLEAPIPNCLEPADAIGPKLDYTHIVKILREGGYDCELLAQETLH
jgi:hypothetical protein